MSILSDRSLSQRLGADLVVQPLGGHAVQPASIDLRLGQDLLIATPDGWVAHDLEAGGPFRLERHAFVLGATLEHVEIPTDLVGVLVGKSSRAREGIQVESAGFVDPGWRGNLTLEIVMLSPCPAWLLDGMPICQLRLEQLTTPCQRPYGHPDLRSHYQGSLGPSASRGVVGRPS